MRPRLRFVTLAIALLSAASPTHGAVGQGRFGFTGQTAFYIGAIDPGTVAQFLEQAPAHRPTRLFVWSPGGEIRAGLRLGDWVHANGIEVVVDRLCMSSCANYVFAAAPRKVIQDGALVLWHGGAEQKEFSGEPFRPLVQAQRAFFARIGVDEYVTRMGHEPSSFEAPWTVRVETMKAFGIGNVSAPADYGSEAYVARAASIGLPRVKPICLDYDASTKAVLRCAGN